MSVRWITASELERMGLERCAGEDCTVYVDPVNTRQERHTSKFCQRHRPRRPRRQHVEQRDQLATEFPAEWTKGRRRG